MLFANKYNPQPLTAQRKAYLRSIADDPEEQIAKCPECGGETSQAQINEHEMCEECAGTDERFRLNGQFGVGA